MPYNAVMAKKASAPTLIGSFVIVRTYSAGVHCGTLVQFDGKQVLLNDARRIWRWQGANTLHEISLHGVGQGSNVSEPVAAIVLTEAIEVIPATDASRQSIASAKWA